MTWRDIQMSMYFADRKPLYLNLLKIFSHWQLTVNIITSSLWYLPWISPSWQNYKADWKPFLINEKCQILFTPLLKILHLGMNGDIWVNNISQILDTQHSVKCTVMLDSDVTLFNYFRWSKLYRMLSYNTVSIIMSRQYVLHQ